MKYLALHWDLMFFHHYASRLCPPLISWIVIQCNSAKTWNRNFSLFIELRNHLQNPKKLWISSLGKCIWELTCILLHTSSRLRFLITCHWSQVFFCFVLFCFNCIIINEFGPTNFLVWLFRFGLCNSRRKFLFSLTKSLYLHKSRQTNLCFKSSTKYFHLESLI